MDILKKEQSLMGVRKVQHICPLLILIMEKTIGIGIMFLLSIMTVYIYGI